jgi:hypothetical protein
MTRRRNCRRRQSTSHFRVVVGTVEYPHRLKSETLRGTPAHRAPTINLRFRRGNQRGMDRAADHWLLPFRTYSQGLARDEKPMPLCRAKREVFCPLRGTLGGQKRAPNDQPGFTDGVLRRLQGEWGHAKSACSSRERVPKASGGGKLGVCARARGGTRGNWAIDPGRVKSTFKTSEVIGLRGGWRGLGLDRF